MNRSQASSETVCSRHLSYTGMQRDGGQWLMSARLYWGMFLNKNVLFTSILVTPQSKWLSHLNWMWKLCVIVWDLKVKITYGRCERITWASSSCLRNVSEWTEHRCLSERMLWSSVDVESLLIDSLATVYHVFPWWLKRGWLQKLHKSTKSVEWWVYLDPVSLLLTSTTVHMYNV